MKALELAKYIVAKCVQDNCPISNLQLQKILYFIQKYFLQHLNQVAFNDPIEAWQFGPVVPDVYYYFCGSGAMPISVVSEYNPDEIPAKQLSIINPIVEEKRNLEPWDLVEETHKPNGAWDQIYRNGAGYRNVIPIGLIKAVG